MATFRIALFRTHILSNILKVGLFFLTLSQYPVIGPLLKAMGRVFFKVVMYVQTVSTTTGDHNHKIVTLTTADEIIKKQKEIYLCECACRTLRKSCDHPIFTCMVFGKVSNGKKITQHEALEIIKSCEDKNLVHNAIFVLNVPVAMCNCCKCACLAILADKYGFDCIEGTGYVATIDEQRCNHCGICVYSCQFEAISDTFFVDKNTCKGCGLCLTKCPNKAISFVKNDLFISVS
ncbi:MAG: 4Fe-4S binding protein [Candidatus Marinimicrobia bacterium]|nr:4Fe-4S binding protein [Candidatus Neomarinimicrobiota bacterium]MDD5583098.1 4Fe-4S binding protein [Candidatus Neomarinimicrobiota bacterium]